MQNYPQQQDGNQSFSQSMLGEDQETVELFFSCRGLKDSDLIGKSDPQLTLEKHIDGNNWAIVGQTEVIRNNLNPDFVKSFKVDFIFETKQRYRVKVVDIDDFTRNVGDFLGQAEFDLADIVGSLHNLKILRLKDLKGNQTGKCIVRMDKVDQTEKKTIYMKLGVEDIPKPGFFTSRNSFIKIYKLRLSAQNLNQIKNNDLKIETLQTDQWLLVYKSKAEKGKSIVFQEFSISGSKLCNNNFDIPLKVELMKHKSNGDHKVIGSLYLTANDLVRRIKKFQFKDNKNNNIEPFLQILNFNSEQYFDFIDFLQGGMNMTLVVGIDFTASNKDPEDPSSLHHLNPPHLNLYQQSILSIGEILQKYNHTKQIPVYGFGARIGNPPQISHFFPINFNYNNPCVEDFLQLFQTYHTCLTNISFSGPTYFAPLLEQVIDFTRRRFEQDPFNYTVFLLMTDGIINDLQQTIDQIVKGCYLPLSIIIVGIGNENFEKMETLDADDEPLVSSYNETMKRDIVQFVPFKKYKNNPMILREEVLMEIPTQVRTFYKMKGIKPKAMQIINTDNFNFNRGQTLINNKNYQDIILEDKNINYPSLGQLICINKI